MNGAATEQGAWAQHRLGRPVVRRVAPSRGAGVRIAAIVALSRGTKLGPYEIAGQIGAGGMGEVYRATDTNLKRPVAIKVLPEAVASDANRLARFQREAEVLASLNHPNIAAIYGLEKGERTSALVMELVEGPTLADLIAEGPLPVDEVLAVARQIAEALEAAHERGIVHRDLKPANVKVRPDGRVKVLDFGLAKAMEPVGTLSPDFSHSPTITTPTMARAGLILGTAAYMSPEQARGRPVDPRADVWAFGCVLYEMLSGRRAFGGEDVSDTLANVLKVDPDWEALPPAAPARVRQAIRVCLQKSPSRRFAGAQDVRLALEGAFETTASPVGHGGHVPELRWYGARLFAAGAVVAGLIAGMVSWSAWPEEDRRDVQRFDYDLPDGHDLSSEGPPVLALSPDGRHFVYDTTKGLYVRAMSELEARLIPGTVLPASPTFSPDGQAVAYFQASQLKSVAISGGASVVIADINADFGNTGSSGGMSWGPDGTIFFAVSTGIYRVPATGGTPELVTAADEGEELYRPQLLPDRESLLFSVGGGEAGQAQIVVQSLASGDRTVVLEGGLDATFVPTGHLVYAFGEELFGIAFDPDSLTVAGRAVPLVGGVARAGDLSGASNFGVSEDGALVYLSGLDTLRTLAWVNRNGGEETIATPPRAYGYPRLSPDGQRLALDLRDEADDIWIGDLARQALTRLTLSPDPDRGPVWTPDGVRVAFYHGRSEPGIYWQRADGSGAPELVVATPDPILFPRSFSPDGNWLVVSNGRSPQDIHLVALRGDRDVEPLLANPAFSESNPEVSPDGRWLSYDSNESGQLEVYVRPFPDVGEGRTQVSIGGGRHPLWSRDGLELFYWREPGTVMAVPVRTDGTFSAGRPSAVVQGDYLMPFNVRQYDVSADGQRFVLMKRATARAGGTDRPRVIVVHNWTEELQRLVPGA